MNTYIERINELKKTPEYIAESLSNELAKTIETELDNRHIKHKDFAKKLNVSKSYVSQILQGQSNMTILTMCKIAHALEMKAEIKFVENRNDNFVRNSIIPLNYPYENKYCAKAESVDDFDEKLDCTMNDNTFSSYASYVN